MLSLSLLLVDDLVDVGEGVFELEKEDALVEGVTTRVEVGFEVADDRGAVVSGVEDVSGVDVEESESDGVTTGVVDVRSLFEGFDDDRGATEPVDVGQKETLTVATDEAGQDG